MKNFAMILLLLSVVAVAQTDTSVSATGFYLDNYQSAITHAVEMSANKLTDKCDGHLHDVAATVYCFQSKVSHDVDCTVTLKAQCTSK
jgi:hypothetical protein